MVEGFAGAVLDVLLRGEHPVLAGLRTQSAAASVRAIETSELGVWIDLWVDESAQPLDVEHRFAIDDVFGRVAGVDAEVGFQLHVVRGRLKTIEAWVSEPGWPNEPSLEETWYVGRDPDPEVAELIRLEARDVEFAVRGMNGDPREQDPSRP